jgi:sulfur-carrier protein
MMRVVLPYHLRTLAGVGGEVEIDLVGAATYAMVVDEIEAAYPMLKGTIREPASGKRRPFVRFFACGQDVSHEGMDAAVPEEVAAGKEVLIVLGAVAGG